MNRVQLCASIISTLRSYCFPTTTVMPIGRQKCFCHLHRLRSTNQDKTPNRRPDRMIFPPRSEDGTQRPVDSPSVPSCFALLEIGDASSGMPTTEVLSAIGRHDDYVTTMNATTPKTAGGAEVRSRMPTYSYRRCKFERMRSVLPRKRVSVDGRSLGGEQQRRLKVNGAVR